MANDLVQSEVQKLSARIEATQHQIRERKSLDECQSAAEFILNCYPNANLPDDVTYLRTIRELFLGYPACVVEVVANPRTGIVTRSKFVPTVQEISEMAEPHLTRMHSHVRNDKGALQQLKNREAEPTEEERKANADRLHALSEEIRIGPLPENPSKARALGWPEWMWDESEQSEKYKELAANFRASQGTPAQVHAARMETGQFERKEEECPE